MLRFEHTQRQGLGGIICKNRNGGLRHNWTFVHLGANEMYGAAADLASCRDDALVRWRPLNAGSSEG